MQNNRITAADRATIEEMINERASLKNIADTIGAHPTTITRELLRNRTELLPVKKSKFRRNPCKDTHACKVRHLCGWKGCNKPCAQCLNFFCHEKCAEFKPWSCTDIQSWPYVCNRCKLFTTCPFERYSYQAKTAQTAHDLRASVSRRGIDVTPGELARLDSIVTPLVLQGQSLWHIWVTHRYEIDVCPSTLYTYLDAGLFTAKRIHLPRAVHFKPRKKGGQKKGERQNIKERSYADYTALFEYMTREMGLTDSRYLDDWDVEFDTVIGRRGGKCLLTVVCISSELLLIRLLDRCTKECVSKAFDELERIFHRHTERLMGQSPSRPWWFFSTALTDNGSEMKDFELLERSVFRKYDGDPRCRIYYCDPYSSWQKPHVEVAHTLIRRVLPKGTSFDNLTQSDLDLLCSHINSYARENLNGAHPFSVAPRGFCGDGIYKALGLEIIKPDSINLTPGLLTR